ncbi:MAG TPA: hypothetical protein VGD78_16905 [Chthoniobacterales bacterium]
MPPIYQPEVAAKAILYASRHDRREVYVGMPTVKAILGDKLFPGLLDRYLARTGYKGQQTNEPEDPDRPDNLYEPVSGDHGAHGRFDNQARGFSPQLWTALHRGELVMAGLLGVAAVALARFAGKDHS